MATEERPNDDSQQAQGLSENPTVELVLDADSTLESKKPKRRRRLWWVIGGLVLVILVVGVVLVETVGRSFATELVRDKIVTSLGLDSSEGVAVDLGSGSLLLQALTGGVDVVTVDIDRFEMNGLASSARMVATDVPLDSSKPLDTLTIDVTVPGDQIDQLAGSLSGLALDSIELNGSTIRISTIFELLFVRIPVAVDLLPVAAGDAIAFEPQSVLLGDKQISVADLRENKLFSGLAGSLLASQEFCVATSLPTALTIDSVAVNGSDLTIELSADGIPLDDAQWQQYGVCPEQ
ncbi:MAG: LmeA family phospholipid-binding protein [Actinomycetales bacterium]|tara:strand:+ start:14449 stop:15327 length:879 start_codon:yes stop_codon:yes gene_type:complete